MGLRQGHSASLSLQDLGLASSAAAPLVKSIRFKPLADLMREFIPLAESDLQILAVRGPEHSQTQIRHIRAYHHMVALRLAIGERVGEIAAALGLTPQTITKLQSTPQFADLVESYRGRIVEKAINHVELMSVVSAEALMALHEKLTADDRDELPVETLRRLAETFVDRIGHSPVRRSETSSVHRIELDARQIEHIKSLHGDSRRFASVSPSQEADFVEAALSTHDEAAAGQNALGGAAIAFLPAQREVKADSDDGTGERL